MSRLSKVLPARSEAVTGAADHRGDAEPDRKALSFFNTFMLIFAVIALLVGAFMIFNTFSITVAQRTRENGLLRALGASRRQVLGSVLLEAARRRRPRLGAGHRRPGFAVALGLKALLAPSGFDIPAGGVVFTPARGDLASSSVSASPSSPRSRRPARRRRCRRSRPCSRRRRQHGLRVEAAGHRRRGVLGLGLAALLLGLFGDLEQPLPIVGAGALLVFFGVSILGRTVSLPLSRAIGCAAATAAGHHRLARPGRTPCATRSAPPPARPP